MKLKGFTGKIQIKGIVRMGKRYLLSCFLAALGLLAAACAPVPSTVVITRVVEVTKEVSMKVQITSTPAPNKVQVYWYIGLGTGTQPNQIPLEKAWVDTYNDSQSEIQVIPIIVDNKYARDNLSAQIAAGNSPDIVGPVGAQGRAYFPGAFLDLSPLVKEFNYDSSDIDPAFTRFYEEEGRMVGLPYAIYPSAIFYNRKLFDNAHLAYPPQKVGEKYRWPDGSEDEWNFETLARLARKLTLDKGGMNATSPYFDPKHVTQYGYDLQWTSGDARWIGTTFGAFYPLDSQGKAVIPDNWRAAWTWYYNGMWSPHPFMPNQNMGELDKSIMDDPFSSGKVAMVMSHLWYAPNIDRKKVSSWDVAVIPSYQGKITANMHGDTFAIMADSKHPKEAFKVYTYMLGAGSADLNKIYGGLPARKSQQAAYFRSLSEQFDPNPVNWQVFVDMIPYMDSPNHQTGLGPNNANANAAFFKLASTLYSKPDLDLTLTFDDFTKELNAIFNNNKH
jgi:multiple sugar transport system substrate-binding protein